MRNSIKLASAYIRYYRKQAMILFLGICMSVLLLNGIASLMYSNRNADYENAKEEYGSWQYAVSVSETLQETKIIDSDGDYHLKRMGFLCSKRDEDGHKNIAFCYGDANYLKMAGRSLLEGEYPDEPNEIALDYYALHNLDIDYSVGSTLKLKGETYTLTGIVSEGAKRDDNSIMVFADKDTVLNMGGSRFYYLEFSDKKRVYGQLSAFLKKNHIHPEELNLNDATAIFVGAEPEETIIGVVCKVLQLKEGRLIYLLGTLNNDRNILQKMVYAVIFIFGIFMIQSIFQVIVEKRISQYGTLEVLGIEEREMLAAMFAELLALFLPAYVIGSLLGNVLAKLLYHGEFKMDQKSLCLGFVLFFLFFVICCIVTVRNLRQYTQAEKLKTDSGIRSRKIVCQKRHNLMGVLSRRFILAKRHDFIRVVISLSLGGVLFICTTYASDNAKVNNIHSMQTDDALYSDISISVGGDDLGNVIPRQIVNSIQENGIKGVKDVFPVTYTLGEVPFNNGVFKWTEYYPEIAEEPDYQPDKEIMEKYDGIATKQGESDYKLKVNVYGYGRQQLSGLSDYLLEGTIDPDAMTENNHVILKQIMDGGGYYDGIDIHPGDHITLKVPKKTSYGDAGILKFQSDDEKYIEKDFVVSATVSRCVGETEGFIGSGTSVVAVIMPQQMMESHFGITDYHSLNINLEESVDSGEVMGELKPLFIGLNQCVIQDNTAGIEKKNAILMQKAYFFYGVAMILFLISLLHAANSMKHQLQSRRYELGVLRAMGITRQGFLKMLMREGFFYGMPASICMLIVTIVCKNVLSGIMQHIIRYIIVSNGLPLLPCLLMVSVNVTVCVLVMLVSGRELLNSNIAEEILCG